MDKVRFGRALGYGARHAAIAVKGAVEAATTPDPAAPTQAERPVSIPGHVADIQRSVRRTQQAAQGAGRSAFGPIKRFSKSLWLEVTGSFFLLIALFLGGAAWKQRAAIYLPPTAHEAQRLYLCLVVFAAFAYFAVSSFVRAQRVSKSAG